MRFSILASAVLLSVPLISAIPTPIAQPDAVTVRAVQLVDLKWVGQVTPGGKNITLTGDAKSIHGQILALNPLFNLEDFGIAPIEKRTVTRYACTINANFAYSGDMQSDIDYLNSLGSGYCYLAANTCTRPSCQWNAAIYWCNDNPYQLAVACNYLGYGMAQVVENNCQWGDGVRGQVWDSGNYNVILAAAGVFRDANC